MFWIHLPLKLSFDHVVYLVPNNTKCWQWCMTCFCTWIMFHSTWIRNQTNKNKKKISAFYPFIYSRLKFQPQLLDRNPKTMRERKNITIKQCALWVVGFLKKDLFNFQLIQICIWGLYMLFWDKSIFPLLTWSMLRSCIESEENLIRC